MPTWNIKATNTTNNTKIEDHIVADSSVAAQEAFLSARNGMAIDINEVSEIIPTQQVATPALDKKCPKCAELVKAEAQVCRFCSYEFVAQEREVDNSATKMLLIESKKKSAGVAALLNLLFAGAGYIYCGRPVLGVLAFIITVAVTVFTAGLGWFFMALVLVIDGVMSANRYNQKLIEEML